MGTEYIILLSIAATAVLMLVITAVPWKGREKKLPGPKAAREIHCGSASVFFDRKRNVIIIPYVKDKFGKGRAISNVAELKAPYNLSELGKLLRKSLESCRNGIPVTSEELMQKLGYTDWKDFSRGKRNIAVHFKTGVGVVFNTTTQRAEGVYELNCSDNEKVLSPAVSDVELGQTLLELLPRCKA